MSQTVPTRVKKDIAAQVAARTGARIGEAHRWVNEVIEVMGDMLIDADPEVRIELRGFGVFEVKRTRPKPNARNPKTNEIVYIPGRRKTHFRPGKRIRDRLQQPLLEDSDGSGDAA